MSDIRITPAAQVVAILVLLALIGVGIAVQLPELERYRKIRSM